MSTDTAPPGNFAWHAFSGGQRSHAVGDQFLLRCGPIIAAASDTDVHNRTSSLKRWVSPGETVFIAGFNWGEVDGFEVVHRSTVLQMVGPHPNIDACMNLGKVRRLDRSHLESMAKLANECHVTPLTEFTFGLGSHFGIFLEGMLVAMAGTRMQFKQWIELAGICTRASQRGQGLATALIRHALKHVHRERGRSMLHVEASNVNAIALYDQMCFRTVRQEPLVVLRRCTRLPASDMPLRAEHEVEQYL